MDLLLVLGERKKTLCGAFALLQHQCSKLFSESVLKVLCFKGLNDWSGNNTKEKKAGSVHATFLGTCLLFLVFALFFAFKTG